MNDGTRPSGNHEQSTATATVLKWIESPEGSVMTTAMIIAFTGAVIFGATWAFIDHDIAHRKAQIDDRLADPIRYDEAIERAEREAREREDCMDVRRGTCTILRSR